MAKITKDQLSEALKEFVPERALDLCLTWIANDRISLRITRSRQSKYGDYRPPINGKGHRISINHDMNQYAFLITFVHEVAHLQQWKKHQRIIEPHGTLWKAEYRKLMFPVLDASIFPGDVVLALENYLRNPAATSCTDVQLLKSLRRYDNKKQKWLVLEDLRYNTPFMIRSGRCFIKKDKLNKNYTCLDMKSKKPYKINPMTEVQPIILEN